MLFRSRSGSSASPARCGAANRAGCGVARSCGTAKCCRSREAAAGHGFTSQLPATQIVLANTPDRTDARHADVAPPRQPTGGLVRAGDGRPQTLSLERARLLPSLTLHPLRRSLNWSLRRHCARPGCRPWDLDPRLYPRRSIDALPQRRRRPAEPVAHSHALIITSASARSAKSRLNARRSVSSAMADDRK